MHQPRGLPEGGTDVRGMVASVGVGRNLSVGAESSVPGGALGCGATTGRWARRTRRSTTSWRTVEKRRRVTGFPFYKA